MNVDASSIAVALAVTTDRTPRTTGLPSQRPESSVATSEAGRHWPFRHLVGSRKQEYCSHPDNPEQSTRIGRVHKGPGPRQSALTRWLDRISAGQEQCQWAFGVSGVMSQGLGDVGGAGQPVQGDGQVPQGGHDLRAVSGADLGDVLPEGHINGPSEGGSRCTSGRAARPPVGAGGPAREPGR